LFTQLSALNSRGDLTVSGAYASRVARIRLSGRVYLRVSVRVIVRVPHASIGACARARASLMARATRVLDGAARVVPERLVAAPGALLAGSSLGLAGPRCARWAWSLRPLGLAAPAAPGRSLAPVLAGSSLAPRWLLAGSSLGPTSARPAPDQRPISALGLAAPAGPR